ncbi:hypothetical protein SLEP1_g46051 [Rubroshorea leprosula]|uniref:Pectinesterase inhibitor domain-containing protein n=1 Tax=Rubroshorea leprosula TaxID=152421 RepID=A0AAV5LL00_9ROSI|nr:hypothetical protein SLEP1_g46051 [Rubroshorea leprosula]
MHDCVEELKDSVYELHRSISEMGETGGKDFSLRMSDIEIWLSAALTDDDTRMDGFSGDAMNGNVKTAVRSQVLNVAHLTSNALWLLLIVMHLPIINLQVLTYLKASRRVLVMNQFSFRFLD